MANRGDSSTLPFYVTGGTSADGDDPTQGAVADAAVAAGAAGTISAKLRSISRDIVANIVLAAGTNAIGSVRATPLTSDTPARVSSSATVVTLAASNANRRSLKIVNESTSGVYVKHGAAATATDYTVYLPPGTLAAGYAYYELPLPIYTGIVTGIWSSANGAAQVTEGA